MKHCLRIALAAVTAVVCGMAAPAWAQAALVDDLGRGVQMSAPPQRIVSLLPSLSETVCVLGACERLVGVDRYSNWPKQLQQQARVVGGGLDPSVEIIAALKPDVVLMTNAPRMLRKLEALGLRTVVLEARTLDDVHQVMLRVGAMLGLPDARVQQAWQQLTARMQAQVQNLPPYVKGTRVYFEVNQGPYAASAGSFIGELLQQLGADNIVDAKMGAFPLLSPEFVLRAQPEVILMGPYSLKSSSAMPGWSSLQAVQKQRVCVFTSEQASVVVRPGPRMDEALAIMAQCLEQKAAFRATH